MREAIVRAPATRVVECGAARSTEGDDAARASRRTRSRRARCGGRFYSSRSRARAIGAGASADGRFEAALALARRLARSVGGGDDERIAPVNGRLYDVFGVVAVPKCFPRCAAADAPRPEVRETWAATRDDLLASAPNEIEAAVERFLSRFETAKEPTARTGTRCW